MQDFTRRLLVELCAHLDYGDRTILAHHLAEQHHWRGTPNMWRSYVSHMLEGRKHFPLTDAPLIYRVTGRDLITPMLQLEHLQIAQAAQRAGARLQ